MSVRDKIAGFGGASSTTTAKLSNGFASTVRIGNNIPMSSSNARSSPGDSAAAIDAVRRLKVPDAFQKNTQATNAPSQASSSRDPPTSAPSKWAAKPGFKAGASNGAMAVPGAAGVSSAASTAGSGAPHSSASVQDSTNNGSTALPAARVVADANKPGSSTAASGSSFSSSRAPASDGEPAAAAGAGSSGNDRGFASPRSRSGKPKAGPRKLNLTRISAEKQRAALGLDKKKKEESGAGQQVRLCFFARSHGAGSGPEVHRFYKPLTRASPNGCHTSPHGRSPCFSPSPCPLMGPPQGAPAAATNSPSHATSSASQGRFAGGTAKAGGAVIPSAGSLRSSGHNLW
ncbi:unnamed protein product [Scytosiphon promiscuus]